MKLLLLAGEESGVLYAQRIAAALRQKCPDCTLRGYADYGFDTSELAVMGFFAVLKRLFFFLRVKRTLERAIDTWRPDIVCTVDYPGMNLALAAYAKKRGIRVVHVVCPQVWAWHQSRIPKIEASLDHLCCFFPFEPQIFRPGLAEFVGHPLVNDVSATRAAASSQEHGTTIALLPGSRMGEIEKILPTLLQSAAVLSARHAHITFCIPAAHAKARKAINRIVAKMSALSVPLVIQDGQARDVLATATCAVVASGTATLEAGLLRCPTLLVYRMGTITGLILRCLIRGVKHVGLVNIIAEKAGRECPMPELLQGDFTTDAVVQQLTDWISHDAARQEAIQKLDATMSLLEGGKDPIGRIADIILRASQETSS